MKTDDIITHRRSAGQAVHAWLSAISNRQYKPMPADQSRKLTAAGDTTP